MCRWSSWCAPTASFATPSGRPRTGFGAKPETYHSDAVFLKAPLTVRHAMRVVTLRDGVDRASAGSPASSTSNDSALSGPAVGWATSSAPPSTSA